jgi:2-polyprenyl-3-methyl-5-hydroxy-6-metoxy-1,4-benzoquinol methylase
VLWFTAGYATRMPGVEATNNRSTLRESILGSARGYQLFKVVTRGARTMQAMADQYIQAQPGQRLLDVGCGYGDLSDHVPNVDYVGIDLNEDYVAYARRSQRPGVRFEVASVIELRDAGLGTFDAAVTIGVLHHLSDSDVTSLLSALPVLLKPGGRYIAAEPVWDPEQQTTARVLAALDRGRFVREQERYEELISPWFAKTTSEIRHDLFWFPYTHCMITATLPE